MPRVVTRDGEIGVGQKGITISMGCVAIQKCQDGKCLGKGSCGERALLSLRRPLWGESREAGGSRTGQDRTRDHLGVREGAGRVQFEKFRTYRGSNSLATRLALLHSSPSMKASIASWMRSKLR